MSENSMYTSLLIYATLAMSISRALYTSSSNRSSFAWYAAGTLTRGQVRLRHKKLDTILASYHSENSCGTVADWNCLLRSLLVVLVLRVVHTEEGHPPHLCAFEVPWITKPKGHKGIARCLNYQEVTDKIL